MRKSVAIWSKHKCVSPDVSVRVCTDSSSSNLEKASVCTHRVHSCVSTAPTAFGVATLMSDPLWLLLSIKLFIQFQDCVCVCAKAIYLAVDWESFAVCVLLDPSASAGGDSRTSHAPSPPTRFPVFSFHLCHFLLSPAPSSPRHATFPPPILYLM